MKILHFLYLNGIDIHFLSYIEYYDGLSYDSIYTNCNNNKYQNHINQYLKVISQDFDYLHNEHNDNAYRKPSFWKEIDDNSADEQSKRSK